MEVILIKDVAGLGAKNDVLTVKAGYGNHYLIPQGFALVANTVNKKIVAENIRQHAQKTKKMQLAAEALAKKVANLNLVLSIKATEQGKIFGSITALQIAEVYKANGIDIDAKQIKITTPIKTVGVHEAMLTLHKEVQVSIKLEVKALA